MAALVCNDATSPEASWEEIYAHVTEYLPSYARPKFLRMRSEMKTTSTHKYSKVELSKSGFDSKECGEDQLFLLDTAKKTYIPFDQDLYEKVITNVLRL